MDDTDSGDSSEIFGHFRRDCPLRNQNTDKMPKVTFMERYGNNHQDYDKYQWINSHYVKLLVARLRDVESSVYKLENLIDKLATYQSVTGV